MLDDPNAPQDPEAPPAEPETPPAPQIGLDDALRMVSEHYGWDPNLAKYEAEEIRQRKADLERRERAVREMESRTRSSGNGFEPPYDADPNSRALMEVLHYIKEDREERRKEREERDHFTRLSQHLDRGYDGLMGRLPETARIDRQNFFGALEELYPDQRLLEAVGIEKAMANTYRYMRGAQPGPSFNNQPTRPPRTNSITVPVGTSGGAGPPSDDLTPHRLPNETVEQFQERAKRIMSMAPKLPTGVYRSSD